MSRDLNLLQACLVGGAAFRDAGELLNGLTVQQASQPVPGAPYTLGALLRHLQVTMRVSLDLVGGKLEAWPEDLITWPDAPHNEPSLNVLITDLHLMLAESKMLASDPSGRASDILADLAVHNAYHWGQVALLRQQLGTVFAASSET